MGGTNLVFFGQKIGNFFCLFHEICLNFFANFLKNIRQIFNITKLKKNIMKLLT